MRPRARRQTTCLRRWRRRTPSCRRDSRRARRRGCRGSRRRFPKNADQAAVVQPGQAEGRLSDAGRVRAWKGHEGRDGPVARHPEDGSAAGVSTAGRDPVEEAARSERESARRVEPFAGREGKLCSSVALPGLVTTKGAPGVERAGGERGSVQLSVRSFDQISHEEVVGFREAVNRGHVAGEVASKDRAAAGIAQAFRQADPGPAERRRAVEIPIRRLHQDVRALAFRGREVVKIREPARRRDPVDRAESGGTSDESRAVEVSVGSGDESGRQVATIEGVDRKAVDHDDAAGREVEGVDRTAAKRPAGPCRAVKASVRSLDDAGGFGAVGPVKRIEPLIGERAAPGGNEAEDLPPPELAPVARPVQLAARAERQFLPGGSELPDELTVDLEFLTEERGGTQDQHSGEAPEPRRCSEPRGNARAGRNPDCHQSGIGIVSPVSTHKIRP